MLPNLIGFIATVGKTLHEATLARPDWNQASASITSACWVPPAGDPVAVARLCVLVVLVQQSGNAAGESPLQPLKAWAARWQEKKTYWRGIKGYIQVAGTLKSNYTFQ